MNKEKIRKLNLFLYGIAIPISIFALYPLFQVLTPEFGSMVWLGAVLCEQDFEPDKMKEPLCNNCNLCVDICPYNLGRQNSILREND